MPRRVWERMTPELPRAPSSAPWASLAAMTPAEVSWLSLISRIAACIVADMLEPVSPSGTGKTLRALIASRCSSSHAAPASRAFLRSWPSKTLIRRGRCARTARGDCSCIELLLPFAVYFLIRGGRWTMTQSLDVNINLGNRYPKHLLNGEFHATHDVMGNR